MIICTNDKRRRLTQEVRTGSSPYNFAYEYDKGGNRTKKRERNTAGQEVKRTDYYYDLPSTQHGVTINPADFKSSNNRLEYYKVYNIDAGSGQATLYSTTWYYYQDDDALDYGNPTRIVTNVAGTSAYTAMRFGYAMNGSTLTYAMGESWNWDGAASCPAGPTGYAINWAREFRYDGARARYLNRQLSPAGLLMNPPQFNSISDVWTDYDDDEPYGDYEVTSGNPPTVTNKRSYQLGMALVDPWMPSGNTATDYILTDHLGTTRGVTLPNAAPADAVTFSAFGEKVAGTNHRYGYVGSHGYQQHDDFKFLHVGHRYYDPATGRFVQRDPIGVIGGLNVYSYVDASPTSYIDPQGLWRSELRPDQKELEKKNREERDRINQDRERRQRAENRRLNTTPVDPGVELAKIKRDLRKWNKIYKYLGYGLLLTPGGQIVGTAVLCGAEAQQDVAAGAGVGF